MFSEQYDDDNKEIKKKQKQKNNINRIRFRSG